MAKRNQVSATTSDAPGAVPDEEVDALYGLPLEEFTHARNELARRLRSKGQRKAADWVGALVKPTAAAWAVNQVMRTQRKDARALLDAGERLRKAHEEVAAGKASARDLRNASADERAAVERLSQAARGLTTASGRDLSESVLERVDETLHAISADSEARSLVESGRLLRERKASGTGMLVATTGEGGASEAKPRRPTETQLRKARERLQRAQREARELRSERTRASREIAGAEQALAQARESLRDADQKVAGKEAEIERLREELEQLRH
jgi:hypothetical protein